MLCVLIRITSFLYKNMLWVLIRIANEAILMSTHNINFYGEWDL